MFGEYAVIKGGQALAMPFNQLSGKLIHSAENNDIQSILIQFAQYLIKTVPQIEGDRFLIELQKGLTFSTNIPMGYGAGSSGVLVSCIFNAFQKEAFEKEDAIAIMRKMEDYFHGKSSGLDPAVSYFNESVYVNNSGNFEFVDFDAPDLIMFLVDTEISRSTNKYVEIFNEKMQHKAFVEAYSSSFKPANEKAINYFLNQNDLEMYRQFKNISEFQYKFMQEMIPASVKTLWQQGLSSNKYYLKLCGAGGGGFLLGITNQFNFELGAQKLIRLF